LIAPYVVNPTEGIWFKGLRKDFFGRAIGSENAMFRRYLRGLAPVLSP
jgi:hypothetical protein